MARRNIVKMGDPLLRKISKPVENFDSKLHQLLDDMADTLHFAEGLGLAAPQVGVLKRVCIVEYDDVLYELVNPVLKHSEGKCVDNEGCLSVVGFRGLVERPEKIDVEYFDRYGVKHKQHAEGYFARVFLHEMDHLDGILFADKMIKKILD
ncbi:peptide deformylase [Corallococcus sp. CAG:1435]|uniref:Peptide deformylase n=1 Tax=Candidatus Fimimonas gallinarum TaxID=2840821 RepID=A0A9D1E520_9BACT|nr:peptide deformylase [Corallococcus sp. CAG:1435]HIR66345.1 peptide deformylase [Candidatus Fimimonas gallinarum]